MVREMVTIQVGQCGNQLGRLFWESALAEHAEHNASGVFDEAMSSFFRNVDGGQRDIPLGDGTGPIAGLKARAVLVDTEGGVVAETLRGPLGTLFEEKQVITDVSGAGNNWAHGFLDYGPRHEEAVREATRRAAELCDSLQCFFLMHSLGGGTGSGLGTYILSLLADDYPEAVRFTTSVFPSEDDDVVTSPYNSVLSLNELVQHADAVLPLENRQLADIASRVAARREQAAGLAGSGGGGGSSGGSGGGAAPPPYRRHGGRMWLQRPRPMFPQLGPRGGPGDDSRLAKGGAVAAGKRAASKAEGFDAMNRICAR